jgi:hypothetical protein
MLLNQSFRFNERWHRAFGTGVAIPVVPPSVTGSEEYRKGKDYMKTEFRCMPLQNGRSEILVHEIMTTLHLNRPEATVMALRMLIGELIIAANMAVTVPEEAHGVA